MAKDILIDCIACNCHFLIELKQNSKLSIIWVTAEIGFE